MRGGYLGAAALVPGPILSRAYNLVFTPFPVQGEPPDRQRLEPVISCLEPLHLTHLYHSCLWSFGSPRNDDTRHRRYSGIAAHTISYPCNKVTPRQYTASIVRRPKTHPVRHSRSSFPGVLQPPYTHSAVFRSTPTLLQADGHGQLAETDLLALLLPKPIITASCRSRSASRTEPGHQQCRRSWTHLLPLHRRRTSRAFLRNRCRYSPPQTHPGTHPFTGWGGRPTHLFHRWPSLVLGIRPHSNSSNGLTGRSHKIEGGKPRARIENLW